MSYKICVIKYTYVISNSYQNRQVRDRNVEKYLNLKLPKFTLPYVRMNK